MRGYLLERLQEMNTPPYAALSTENRHSFALLTSPPHVGSAVCRGCSADMGWVRGVHSGDQKHRSWRQTGRPGLDSGSASSQLDDHG